MVKTWRKYVEDSNLNLYLKIDKENGLMKIINLDTNATLKIIKIKW